MKCFSFKLAFILWLTGIASVATGQSYHYYFGNIHAHSSYSDGAKDGATTGVLTPSECYKYAKSSEHFDFLGISEHNHLQAKMHLLNYAKGLSEAKAANEDGKFVCLYGMEYGVIKNGGHVIIYGFDRLIGWEPNNYTVFSAKSDYSHLFHLIAGQPGAFATLAHPATTDYNNLISKVYDPTVDQAVTGVAISSGPAFSTAEDYSNRAPIKYYGYYKKLLALGYSVGPTMDHDNHYTTFGHMSPTRTVLLSQVLSRDSLLAAYHAGRFYASEDWDTQVDFRVNGQPMGSHLKGVTNLLITATVEDPDPGDNIKSIQLWYGKPGSGETAKVLKVVNGQKNLQLQVNLKAGERFYYFLEITETDGDRVVTSPVWATGSKEDDDNATVIMSSQSGSTPYKLLAVHPDQPGPLKIFQRLKTEKQTPKTNITMNPQIIFWLAFAVLGISVAYCSKKYCMLKDSSTAVKQPYSWSRVQLAWWTVIILSSFIAILIIYNEAPTLTTSTVILLGISAATTAIARTIDVSNATSPTTPATPAREGSSLILDILSDQNGVSIHRFQTVVFNFVFGCWFIVTVLEHLHNMPEDGINAIMPDFADTNLVLLGVSSATYAALKTTEKKPTEKPAGPAAPATASTPSTPVTPAPNTTTTTTTTATTISPDTNSNASPEEV